MRIYFLSETLCGLTVNGAYLGLVDGFERAAELDPADGLFVEYKPCGGLLPLSFRLDEEFLHSPPPQVALYYTEKGLAIYASGFLRADQTLKVLRQERLGGALLTLMRQGKLQLSLENETGFHLLELPDDLEDCTFSVREEGFLLAGERGFALLSRAGERTVLSEGKLLPSEDSLKAEVPFHDSMGHTAVLEWKRGKLVACAIRSAREPVPATFALALFESALIGADCAPFLSESLAPKAGKLKEYLGDFRSVVLTEEADKVGLVYERKPRVFDVRYFRVETQDGKIANLKACN